VLSDQQLHIFVQSLNLPGQPRITRIKVQNDVYRIDCGNDVLFLKTYTKDWYGSDVVATGFNANHEATAWTILAHHGVTVPEVVEVATSADNPLARPFILTRQLAGTSLTTLMTAYEHQRGTLLSTVGNYLQQMHCITFAFPGYLTTLNGPIAAPAPQHWQHRCW
jgi:aminoglycoside phosphotransferase